jgi:hypothetical protein
MYAAAIRRDMEVSNSSKMLLGWGNRNDQGLLMTGHSENGRTLNWLLRKQLIQLNSVKYILIFFSDISEFKNS